MALVFLSKRLALLTPIPFRHQSRGADGYALFSRSNARPSADDSFFAAFRRTSEKVGYSDRLLVAEWAGMCQEAANPLASERLEAIATVAPQGHAAHICLAIA